eukprot:TRINITY_DN3052_c0_g2_i1.p1 TRINITY_DN3052_c0_g2~~TRINITY_DN3052_c0_g2_i1.p1  ORF type:complete len:732 (+),score=213.63 TRINITY_DN3052_c0_g2_i1:292-2196(+)
MTKREQKLATGLISMVTTLFLLIPYCFISANFVVFLIKEKQSKAKHLQVTCGVNLMSFWLANIAWDVINFLVIVFLSMIIFSIFGNKEYVGTADRFFATAVLLLFFGFSTQCMAYPLSFLFESPTSAQLSIAGITNLFGFVLVIVNYILELIDMTRDTNHKLKYLYRIFPPFNFGEGLMSIPTIEIYSSFYGTKVKKAFDWDITGRSIFLMFVEGLVLFLVALGIDLGWFRWLKIQFTTRVLPMCKPAAVDNSACVNNKDEKIEMEDLGEKSSDKDKSIDEDVLREAERVADVMKRRQAGEYKLGDDEEILCQNLTKVFPPRGKAKAKVAVDSLNLIVPKGECFGFLGTNGAGKTTTLSMLTHDIEPTSGDAFVAGCSAVTDIKQMRSLIGYCPQFDPLIDKMTGKEHLRLFGRLKGIPEDKLELACDQLLEHTGMKKWGNNLTEGYSGGTKRKLSLAIALIGSPEVVFLDEPSSGMDPVARRHMWDVIKAAAQTKSVTLTTHNMEECEALCTRVGIMVGGRFNCLGAVQHLKSKFGKGYFLEIKTRAKSIEEVKSFVSKHFKTAVLSEEHEERVKYSLPKEAASLREVFSKIEERKKKLHIVDYSVSQTTLEEVFVNVAKHHEEEEDAKKHDE